MYRIVTVRGKRQLQIDPPTDAGGQASYSIGGRAFQRLRLANCDFFVLDTRGQREMNDTMGSVPVF